MKKHIVFLVITVLLISVFVACSSSSSVITNNTVTDTPTQENVETEGEYMTEIATLDSSEEVFTEDNETEILTIPTTDNPDTTVDPEEEVTHEIVEEPTFPIATEDAIELPFIPVEP